VQQTVKIVVFKSNKLDGILIKKNVFFKFYLIIRKVKINFFSSCILTTSYINLYKRINILGFIIFMIFILDFLMRFLLLSEPASLNINNKLHHNGTIML
jgi:hypothetical protein